MIENYNLYEPSVDTLPGTGSSLFFIFFPSFSLLSFLFFFLKSGEHRAMPLFSDSVETGQSLVGSSDLPCCHSFSCLERLSFPAFFLHLFKPFSMIEFSFERKCNYFFKENKVFKNSK